MKKNTTLNAAEQDAEHCRMPGSGPGDQILTAWGFRKRTPVERLFKSAEAAAQDAIDLIKLWYPIQDYASHPPWRDAAIGILIKARNAAHRRAG